MSLKLVYLIAVLKVRSLKDQFDANADVKAFQAVSSQQS